MNRDAAADPRAPIQAERPPHFRGSLMRVSFQFIFFALTAVWAVLLCSIYFGTAYVLDSQFDERLVGVGDRVVNWLYAQPAANFDLGSPDLYSIYTDQGMVAERSLSIITEPSHRFLLDTHVYREKFEGPPCLTSDWRVSTLNLGNVRVRSLCRLIAPSATAPNNIIVWLTAPLEQHEKRVLATFLAAAIPVFLAALASLVIIYFGLRRGRELLRRLQAPLAGETSLLGLQPMAAESTPRELVPLVTAINHLLRHAEQHRSTERRFLANAAHQLRAPLAGLGAQAELALKSTDADALARCMKTIHEQVETTGRLIGQFLSLAQLEDRERLRQSFHAFNAAQLCESVLRKYLPAAREKRIDLGLSEFGVMPHVYGNQILVGELLSNLVDNAVKYTPAGGTVTLGAAFIESTGDVEFSVEDSGIGMSAQEMAAVFAPFTRLGKSEQPGVGLGFSIVQEIAAIHDAVIQIQRSPAHNTGTRITVTLHGLARARDQERRPDHVPR